MRPIPASWYTFLEERVLPVEGGYTSGTVKNGRVIDPETLFGITKPIWLEVIPQITPQMLASMPEAIADRIRRIQSTPSNARGTHVSSFIRDTARLLDPIGNASQQPERGRPLPFEPLPRSWYICR